MQHCWKSHVTAHIILLNYFITLFLCTCSFILSIIDILEARKYQMLKKASHLTHLTITCVDPEGWEDGGRDPS